MHVVNRSAFPALELQTDESFGAFREVCGKLIRSVGLGRPKYDKFASVSVFYSIANGMSMKWNGIVRICANMLNRRNEQFSLDDIHAERRLRLSEM